MLYLPVRLVRTAPSFLRLSERESAGKNWAICPVKGSQRRWGATSAPPPENQPSSLAKVWSLLFDVMCQVARAGPPSMAPVLPTACLAAPGIQRSVILIHSKVTVYLFNETVGLGVFEEVLAQDLPVGLCGRVG